MGGTGGPEGPPGTTSAPGLSMRSQGEGGKSATRAVITSPASGSRARSWQAARPAALPRRGAPAAGAGKSRREDQRHDPGPHPGRRRVGDEFGADFSRRQPVGEGRSGEEDDYG